jgi:hypothetical protein
MTLHSENYNEELSIAQNLVIQNEEDLNKRERFGRMSKEEIIETAESLIQTADVKSAYEDLLLLKKVYEKLASEERPAQIQEWITSGNDPKDFIAPQDELKTKLLDIFNRFHKLREEEKKRAEEEKLANLKTKQLILEKIRGLVDSEESENTLANLRELMREWKEVRSIPKEFHEALSSEYKVLIDKYYDNLSIFNELKDLDREKNLELKIELIKKVEALKDEPSMRKAIVILNKYHEDWKNTGPVRREISDEIWSRFKSASDIIIEKVKLQRAESDLKRQTNLESKLLLIEKSEAAITALPESTPEWQKLSKELDLYFEEWKKIGPVPSAQNEEVWSKFQSIRNHFYQSRKQFFKELNKNRIENLKLKEALCEKAESLKGSEEFMKTSDVLKELQEQWKKIGPVPEEQSQALWNRFRSSLDEFFERRNVFFDERKKSESVAVEARESIIEKIQKLHNNPSDVTFEVLKNIQQDWNRSGFVSGKRFHSLNNKYQKLIDPLFQNLREQNKQERVKNVKSHVEGMSQNADGKSKLKLEERRIKETIKKIDDEISTIDNNKSFFQLSKNADAVLKQFDDKIKKLKEQRERLQAELEVYKQSIG